MLEDTDDGTVAPVNPVDTETRVGRVGQAAKAPNARRLSRGGIGKAASDPFHATTGPGEQQSPERAADPLPKPGTTRKGVPAAPPHNLADPVHLARLYLGHIGGGGWFNPLPHTVSPIVRFWRGDFYRFNESHYRVMEKAEIEGGLWRFLDALYVAAWQRDVGKLCSQQAGKKAQGGSADGPPLPSKKIVTRNMVNEVTQALKSLLILQGDMAAPFWIGGGGERPHPDNLICFPNGLLDTTTKVLTPPDIDYFTLHTMGGAYDPDAPPPKRWLEFLAASALDGETQLAIRHLFGLCLVPDTSHQIVPVFFGPRGSGKSTYTSRIEALLGGACVGTSIQSLGNEFGLAPLVKASVALIADATFTKCSAAALERIKTISGEGLSVVNRKNHDHLCVRMKVRFVMASNSLPNMEDPAHAMGRRYVLLHIPHIVPEAKIDKQLGEKLDAELAGIMAWAVEGLYDLRRRGRFLRPSGSADMVADMADAAAPLAQFVRERLIEDPAGRCTCDEAYCAWRAWSLAQGIEKIQSKGIFAVQLRSIIAVKVSQPRDPITGKNPRAYMGLRLRRPSDDAEGESDLQVD